MVDMISPTSGGKLGVSQTNSDIPSIGYEIASYEV
jgi:hypothetical protein